jgi:hypothetical protein
MTAKVLPLKSTDELLGEASERARVPTFSEPRGNARWQAGLFARHAGRYCDTALRPHIQRLQAEHSYRAANTRLRELDAQLQRDDLLLSWDDARVRDWCEDWAAACRRMAERCEAFEAVQAGRRILARYGLELPEPRQWGLSFADTYAPTLARLGCARWWRRQVRTLQRRALDNIARDIRQVSRFEQIYCADDTVGRYRQQRHRNRALLESLAAVNQYGEGFTLAELAGKSLSNPANRRAELMTRLRGFETVAESRGHVAEFYTLTAPSKYHRYRGREANPGWNGATPRQVQGYFMRIWARIRAAWQAAGVRPYGFRIVEPHHDGCPHWHLLLWMPRTSVRDVRRTLRTYALAEDGDEPGAARHRFKPERIDPAKGSAVHYVAKYVAKNIDGHAVGEDLYGRDAESSAERILAWASTHGIRQFQQIGGPTVGVWRELRRIEGDEAGEFGDLVAAADGADWAAYVELMGGPEGRRADAPVQLARWLEYDPDTGETLQPWTTRYGDASPGRVFGLLHRGVYHLTRPYRWAIQWTSTAAAAIHDAWQEYCQMNFTSGAPPGAAFSSVAA